MLKRFHFFTATTATMGCTSVNSSSSHSSHVHFGVLRLRYDFKVFDSVIQFVAILVVNFLSYTKLSTKVLLHYVAMLLYINTVNSYSLVSILVYPIRYTSTSIKWVSPALNASKVLIAKTMCSIRIFASFYRALRSYSHSCTIALIHAQSQHRAINL